MVDSFKSQRFLNKGKVRYEKSDELSEVVLLHRRLYQKI